MCQTDFAIFVTILAYFMKHQGAIRTQFIVVRRLFTTFFNRVTIIRETLPFEISTVKKLNETTTTQTTDSAASLIIRPIRSNKVLKLTTRNRL